MHISDLQQNKHSVQQHKHVVIFRLTTLMLLINTPYHQLIQNVKHNVQIHIHTI